VVTYLRVSTSEQALSGLGLDAQRVTVAAYAERKGLTIVEEYCATRAFSAKSLTGRPAALAALEAVRGGAGYQVTTPKSDAGIRDVAIPPHLLPAIEQHLAKHVGPEKDALLFPAAHGGHMAPATLYRRFYAARDAAGRTDLRFHDLRHSGAVLAAATGATLAELMGRLGHSTPAAALRYQHVAGGRDKQIAALLSELATRPTTGA
jgi:integrase